MDSFNVHKLKAEKVNKNRKHRQLRMIGNFLRCLEMCVVLVLISKLSIQQLPLFLKNTSDYFSGFMLGPRFVFLIGNVIIITLFAQSGQFSAAKNGEQEPDLYLEFLQNSTMNQKNLSMRVENGIRGHRNDGCMIKYQEKQKARTKTSLEEKDYKRCKSDIVKRVQRVRPQRVLQRCETDNNRRRSNEGGGATKTEKVGKSSYPEDGMSNEEFRCIVEAFIARQQRLRTQELLVFSSSSS